MAKSRKQKPAEFESPVEEGGSKSREQGAGSRERRASAAPDAMRQAPGSLLLQSEIRNLQSAIPERRVGIGYDIHRLVEGRKLVLGGIEIPHIKGLAGHSDADVLVHSICDALLGAARLGDLGQHFPETDPQYKNIPSTKLLRRVGFLVAQRGFELENLDATIIAEGPRLKPFIEDMRLKLADVMNISPGCISIKAKTNEGLDAIGRGEAMAAHAVCLLREKAGTD
jgi:2-C-methyl-D-erythritol 2,4-cyclodiphosphate synthase